MNPFLLAIKSSKNSLKQGGKMRKNYTNGIIKVTLKLKGLTKIEFEVKNENEIEEVFEKLKLIQL